MRARLEPARPTEDGVIGHAAWLGHGRNVIAQFFAVALQDAVHRPAGLGVHHEILLERAVHREADLLEILAVIGEAVAAGRAITAPLHLLHRHRRARLEIVHILAHLDHFRRKLVASSDGELGQAGVIHVPFLVPLVEVDVRAAYATRLHFQQRLARLGDLRHRLLAHYQLRIAPHVGAGDRLAGLLLPLRDGVVRAGIPFGIEYETFHVSSFLRLWTKGLGTRHSGLGSVTSQSQSLIPSS